MLVPLKLHAPAPAVGRRCCVLHMKHSRPASCPGFVSRPELAADTNENVRWRTCAGSWHLKKNCCGTKCCVSLMRYSRQARWERCETGKLVCSPQAHAWNTLETARLVYSPQACEHIFTTPCRLKSDECPNLSLSSGKRCRVKT